MVDLIVNGNFSATDPNDADNPASWTVGGETDGREVSVIGDALRFNRANLEGTGTAEQVVTGVNIGDTVDFSFDYSEVGSGSAQVSVDIVILDANGMEVVNQTVTNASTFTTSFTATTSSYTVRFVDSSTGTNSRDAVVDNVVFDVTCFAAGTLISTPKGKVPIESLRVGDLVNTMDNGPQPIVWHGAASVAGAGRFAPVRFSAGSIGNDKPLFLSPDHRVLLSGHHTDLLFGEREVFANAKALVNRRDVVRVEVPQVEYHHILFEEHQVIWGNGAPSESLFPDMSSVNEMETASRDEIFALFPELKVDHDWYGKVARMSLQASEIQALVHR